MNPNQITTEDPIINNNKQDDDLDSGEESDVKPSRRSGRRKIKIEYIEDKNRRHITFSKRKAGIMKKAYELSTLTGTQVLLLVVSETGLVYTFTTVKLQPIVTKPEGKNLIQACLNAPDPIQNDSNDDTSTYNPSNGQSRVDIEKKPVVSNVTPPSTYEDKKVDTTTSSSTAANPASAAPSGYNSNATSNVPSGGPYQQQQQAYGSAPPTGTNIPPMSGYNHPGYMNAPYQQNQPQQPQQQQQQQSPQQQQQQQPYGQMPGGNFYGNQQQHYMQQQQQHPGYWPNNNNPSSPAMRQQEQDEKARRGLPPNKK